MRRRDAVKLLLAAGATGCARAASKQPTMTETTTKPMPAIFLAHGSPFLLDDGKWVGELGDWARALPRPRAVLMLSAHWVDRPITIGATRRVPLVYDFYGFPAKYYQITYDAPPAPELATRLRGLLAAEPVAEAPERGLDHGAYVPLVCMYPAADVPVLQVSLPTLDPTELFALGRALAPLRREGVLIVGSGFLTHNLRSHGLPARRAGADLGGRVRRLDGRRARAARRRRPARLPAARARRSRRRSPPTSTSCRW